MGRPKRWTVRCADTTSLSLSLSLSSRARSSSPRLFLSRALARFSTAASHRVPTAAFSETKAVNTGHVGVTQQPTRSEPRRRTGGRSGRRRRLALDRTPRSAVPPADVQSSHPHRFRNDARRQLTKEKNHEGKVFVSPRGNCRGRERYRKKEKRKEKKRGKRRSAVERVCATYP